MIPVSVYLHQSVINQWCLFSKGWCFSFCLLRNKKESIPMKKIISVNTISSHSCILESSSCMSVWIRIMKIPTCSIMKSLFHSTPAGVLWEQESRGIGREFESSTLYTIHVNSNTVTTRTAKANLNVKPIMYGLGSLLGSQFQFTTRSSSVWFDLRNSLWWPKRSEHSPFLWR